MPRQVLKQKLRAADRRRSRRPAPRIESTRTSERESIDVLELIASAILEYIDASDSEMRDGIVISAMRSSLKGGAATGKQSLPLCQRLERIAQRPEINQRSYRDALQQMLKLALEHQDPKNPTAFIHYLGVLAS